MNSNCRQAKPGFTIVELLVVIVVIGILAAVTMVTYVGIAQKATAASLQSDLKSASTQLEMYKAENGSYPPEGSQTVANLPKSNGSEAYTYTLSNGQYILSATDNTNTFYISSTTGTIGTGTGIPLGWKQISANGGSFTCAVTTTNNAYCWGLNSFGVLGDNTTSNRRVPTAVYTAGLLSGKTVKSITAGGNQTCAIASDNLAYCWGYNSGGQLGNNSTANSSVPVAVDTSGVLSGKTIKAINSGSMHVCAIASDDLPYCWGTNGSGALGNNAMVSSSVPVATVTTGVLSGKTVKLLSSGGSHTCVVASDNLAYCWGADNYGQLGNNSTTNVAVPVAVVTSGVLSGKTIKSVASGSQFTCALASDDKPYCWGRNNYGQLGNNSTTDSSVPVAVDMTGVLSGKTAKALTVGNTNACVIASDNNAYCWGQNNYGQLGDNTTTDNHVPVTVNISGELSGKTLQSVVGGSSHICSIASDALVYCWGYNGFGQFGNNSVTSSSVPTVTQPPPGA